MKALIPSALAQTTVLNVVDSSLLIHITMDIIVFFRQADEKIILRSFENGQFVLAMVTMLQMQIDWPFKLEIEILATN